MGIKTVFLVLLAMLSASVANATPITVPSGLTPGSTYFLAFVTAGARDATSTNIADYDTFVTNEANTDPALLALGTTWKVIGSTATVNAVDHIGAITSPIYNLHGDLVDTGSADLFDGNLTAPIEFNQHGALVSDELWTGSTVAGTSSPYPLGCCQAPLSFVTVGYNASTDFSWIDVGVGGPASSFFSLYGISGPLTVPSPTVPEPGSLVLLGSGLLFAESRWRRRRRASRGMTESALWALRDF